MTDKKPHGMTGKQNRLIGDAPKESVITFRCPKELKTNCINAAAKEGISYVEYCIEKLQEATNKTLNS